LFYFTRDESNSRNASIRKWNLKFQRSPVEFLPMPAVKKLSGVRFEVNNLVEVCIFISVVSNVIQGFILYPLSCVINILGHSNKFLYCFEAYSVTLHLKFQPPSQDKKKIYCFYHKKSIWLDPSITFFSQGCFLLARFTSKAWGKAYENCRSSDMFGY